MAVLRRDFARHRARRPDGDPGHPRAFDREQEPPALVQSPLPMVSVLIPAFNEARVIEGSVRRVLASEGRARSRSSSSMTARRTRPARSSRKAFADEPRVRLLTLENGGKARALNLGLELATSDIIIALDADTQFETTTIARLARWFADRTNSARWPGTPRSATASISSRAGKRPNTSPRRTSNGARIDGVRRDHRRARRGRGVAACGARCRRRLSGRYARGGSGSDHRDPARGLARGL